MASVHVQPISVMGWT